MAKYFNTNFPTVAYSFGDNESPVLFNNLSAYVDIVDQIKDNVASVIDKYYSHTFELKEAFPNPSSHKTNIQFNSGVSHNISFVIYNLLGEVIYSNEISANTGINTITISTSDFSDGVYMYSINNRESILTKRMIVSH